jgi:hypothetical protein
VRLEDALVGVDMGLQVLAPLDDSATTAEGRLIKAELLIALARPGRTGGLAEADTLIRAAGGVLTLERYPLQHPKTLQVRSLWHLARARLATTPADRERELRAARVNLVEALTLVSPTEEPFRWRQLNREMAALPER